METVRIVLAAAALAWMASGFIGWLAVLLYFRPARLIRLDFWMLFLSLVWGGVFLHIVIRDWDKMVRKDEKVS